MINFEKVAYLLINDIERVSLSLSRFLEISFGDFDESDIVRIEDDYKRV